MSRVTVEFDSTNPQSGEHAISVIRNVFGNSGDQPALAPSQPVYAAPAAAAPAPSPVPTAPTPTAPAAPTAAAPAPSAPAPAPSAPASAPAPAPSPSSGGGLSQADFAAQVQAYAGHYGAKPTKARFQQLADAYQQPTWVSTGAIPADKYAEIIAAGWFTIA